MLRGKNALFAFYSVCFVCFTSVYCAATININVKLEPAGEQQRCAVLLAEPPRYAADALLTAGAQRGAQQS